MNVMFIIDNKMVTPALSDRILAGITRASILALGTEMGLAVEERAVSVAEIEKAARSGALQEAFGMGTAAVVSMISHIGFDTDNMLEIPVPENGIGAQIKKRLNAIRTGDLPDTNRWMLKIN
jgi:branched-chain amino acid aminotransferase